jgi:hypothetical protein
MHTIPYGFSGYSKYFTGLNNPNTKVGSKDLTELYKKNLLTEDIQP